MRLYEQANEALQRQLQCQQDLAIAEQELRNHKLLNLKLEEDIDLQTDKKIKLQQNSQKNRKMIARTIRKTQTFLVDSEKLLRGKLLAVSSMGRELGRLEKERGIIE